MAELLYPRHLCIHVSICLCTFLRVSVYLGMCMHLLSGVCEVYMYVVRWVGMLPKDHRK